MADRIAAFGGCLAVNRPITRETAEMINANYLEVVAAPDYEEGAIPILAKRRNLRIIRLDRMADLARYRDLSIVEFKSLIDGGIIVQQSQRNRIRSRADFLPATTTYQGAAVAIERQPTEREYDDMLFGWNVEQGVTSNSVIYVKDGVTVGIGTGEQDRVGVAEIAAFKAYTKYTDALCFRKYGIPFEQYEREASEGKRDQEELGDFYAQTKMDRGGILDRSWCPTPSSRSGTAWMWGSGRGSPRSCSRAVRTGTSSPSRRAMRRTRRSPWCSPGSAYSSIDVPLRRSAEQKNQRLP